MFKKKIQGFFQSKKIYERFKNNNKIFENEIYCSFAHTQTKKNNNKNI